MSRATVSNDKYKLAFGIDHTPMGCFFQLYEKAAKGECPEDDETDRPQIGADEVFGLDIANPKTLERNPKLAFIFKDWTTKERIVSYLRTEKYVIEIGKACDLDIEKKVYELWD